MHSWTVFGHADLPTMLTSSLACSLKDVSRPFKYCCGLSHITLRDVQILTPFTNMGDLICKCNVNYICRCNQVMMTSSLIRGGLNPVTVSLKEKETGTLAHREKAM